MIPYYILVAAPFLFSVVQFESKARQMIDKKKNYPILIFFSIYLLLIALRSVVVGYDTPVYNDIFNQMEWTDWKSLFDPEREEKLFYFMNKFIVSLGLDFQVLLSVAAVLTVIPLMKLYYDHSENSMVTIAIFLILPTFVMNFSGIRQGIAVSIGILAFYAVKRKKPIQFLLWVLIAIGFHRTAFMLLFMYPLYHIRFRTVHLAIFIPLYGLLLAFNKQIFSALVPLLGEKYEDRYNVIAETGAYAIVIMLALFLLYAFIVPDESCMDPDTKGFRNFAIIAVALQLFAPINSVAMRLNYYYLVFIPLLVPRITNRWKTVSPFIRDVVNIIMIVFFIGYYFLVSTSKGTLGIYPYVPFWE